METVLKPYKSILRSRRSTFEYWVALGLLSPCLLIAWFQLQTAVNVPWSDEWRLLLPFVDRYLHAGKLKWAELWAPYFTHRVVLPKLIFIASTAFDHLDFRHLQFLNTGILALAGIVLLRQSFPRAPGRQSMWLIPAMLVFFSLRQWENLGWAMQLGNFLALLWYLVAVGALETAIRAESKWLSAMFLSASLAAGILASVSAGNGILVWPALILQAALGNRRWQLIAVVLTACSVWLLYYRGIEQHAFLLWVLTHPLSVAMYVFRNLGASLVAEKASAVLLPLGVVLAVIYAVSLWTFWRADQDQRAYACPFLAYFTIAIANTASFVCGRLAIGISQPDASRYSTLTLLAPVGSLMILHICGGWHRIAIATKWMLASLMVAGALYADATMVGMAPHMWQYKNNLVRVVLKEGPRTPRDYQPFMIERKPIDRGIRILREHHLGPFYSGSRAVEHSSSVGSR